MDARSVETIYREHGHSVLRRARRILGTEDDARDVLQEIFASILDQSAAFRGESSIVTWLYSATTHACLNRIRNKKTRARRWHRANLRTKHINCSAAPRTTTANYKYNTGIGG